MRIGDLTRTDDGDVLIGVSGGGLLQFAGDRLESYPIRDATNRDRLFPDRNVDSNKLLRDRDGGLWIGTHQRGLVHIHNGRTDVFTKADGLSGDISCSLFEDREGNIWVATTRRTRPVSRAPRHYDVRETRPLQRRDSVRARGHGWEHLGCRPRMA